MVRYIFTDADGTLFENQAKYERHKRAPADLVWEYAAEHGDTPVYALDLEDDHVMDEDAEALVQNYLDRAVFREEFADTVDAFDSQRYGRLGVTRDRFKDSVMDAAAYFFGQLGLDPGTGYTDDFEQYWEHGMAPMEDYSEDDLLPGAEEALDHMNAVADAVIAVTKGIEDVQREKFEQTGIIDRLDSVIVVQDKTPQEFNRFTPAEMHQSVMIGDKVSDGLPILEAGGGFIYKPRKGWRGDADEELPRDGAWTQIDSLHEVPDALAAFEERSASIERLIAMRDR